ncbi:MAG: putative porin, partial [Rubricoccaceae bacterium]|nr:putative porin [Rubricoccaceae bacterium]
PRVGSFYIDLNGYASVSSVVTRLFGDTDSAAVVLFGGDLNRAGGSLSLWWRKDAERGLYAVLHGAASTVLNADVSALHRAEADALPATWGGGRLGVRGENLFNGNLDIDLAVRGRAWTEFLGRAFIPSAAVFALPDPSTATIIPASGTVDFLLEATLQDRARLFLVYENALAGSAYDGAFTVPVHPILARRFRFGVFWTLFG